MNIRLCVILLPLLFLACSVIAQSLPRQNGDSTETINGRLASSYIHAVSAKAGKIDAKLDDYTGKVLSKAQKQEKRLKQKLQKIDSLKSARVFATTEQQYKQLQERLSKSTSLQHYIPSLDTLSNSLKFLKENEKLIAATTKGKGKLTEAMTKIKGMEGQFQKAEEVTKFLKERKEYLREQLKNLGFAKELKKLNKQSYYFSEQLKEYKNLLQDHRKAERKVIELLSNTKLFKNFMAKNSYLASFFRLPDDPNSALSLANMSGLQTRAQVSNLVQQQIISGGAGAQQQFQQNMQQAQSQLATLKSKINQMGAGSSNADMPEGFKPNNQKTKNFLKRLEFGTNIQSQKANGYWPVTSDNGLSIGYKLNNKSIIGIGASYKLGLGKSIRHIKLTQQGYGIRSFVDWKIKGGLWLSGGFEMNHRKYPQLNLSPVAEVEEWQQSGLIGLSKVLSLKTKLFKRTKFSLMWDFLSYRQAPMAQPVILRVGYSFSN